MWPKGAKSIIFANIDEESEYRRKDERHVEESTESQRLDGIARRRACRSTRVSLAHERSTTMSDA